MNGVEVVEMIPLFVPLVLIQFTLIGVAIYDLVKRKRVRGGNKIVWGLIIVLIGYLGPILYFVIGREEE